MSAPGAEELGGLSEQLAPSVRTHKSFGPTSRDLSRAFSDLHFGESEKVTFEEAGNRNVVLVSIYVDSPI